MIESRIIKYKNSTFQYVIKYQENNHKTAIIMTTTIIIYICAAFYRYRQLQNDVAVGNTKYYKMTAKAPHFKDGVAVSSTTIVIEHGP